MQPASHNEADRNYAAFQELLPKIVLSHRGQFALLHDAMIVDYFESSLAATLDGARKFGLNRFSVQEVTTETEHLGFYSYVGGTGDY